MIVPKWWRNWRARKRLEKQAQEVTMPTIANIEEGQRVGIAVPMAGTVMIYRYKYKIQRIRSNGDVVLKQEKEVL